LIKQRMEETISNGKLREIEETIKLMGDMSLRTVAYAYRNLSPEEERDLEIMEPDSSGIFGIEKSGLTFISIVGITDVLKDGVAEAIRICQEAGVRVIMITGDNRETAVAIGRESGIIQTSNPRAGSVLLGSSFMEQIGGVVCKDCGLAVCGCRSSDSSDLRDTISNETFGPEYENQKSNLSESANRSIELSKNPQRLNGDSITEQSKSVSRMETGNGPNSTPLVGEKNYKQKGAKLRQKRLQKTNGLETIKNGTEFDKIICNLKILARSRPEDKYALVLGLKERGHVVAVTGDGTNDAPALSKADVGFAMGIQGTEVAKNVADIIVMDDNFCSIVKAIVRGRNIYDCIRKFLMFQLTVNVVALFASLISAVLLNYAIISTIQMLWLNLIMDTLASLALATEPPNSEELLKRKPYPKDDNILSNKMLKHIIGQAIFQLVGLGLVVFKGKSWRSDITGTILEKGTFLVTKENDPSVDASVHLTYVFNTFVFMQVFNFINSRRILDEFDTLKNIRKSRTFLCVLALVILLQILIINNGGKTFSISPKVPSC
jgi:magnesium-transporting ATPase (P-type)